MRKARQDMTRNVHIAPHHAWNNSHTQLSLPHGHCLPMSSLLAAALQDHIPHHHMHILFQQCAVNQALSWPEDDTLSCATIRHKSDTGTTIPHRCMVLRSHSFRKNERLIWNCLLIGAIACLALSYSLIHPSRTAACTIRQHSVAIATRLA